MEHIINKIDKDSLKPGDHIYAYRKLHTYSHHGIFIGGDRVIHYNRTKDGNTSQRAKPSKNCGVDKNHLRGVVKSCVDCFLKHHTLRRFQYGVGYGRYLTNWPGTNNGFGDYNLFENNCEAFAMFCKTEKRVSDQACSAMLLIKASVKVAMDRLLRES
ncbi:protein LEAD-SENSITIVE 1-like [Rosa rugosa]|uniref:protein LEAD-SENSITIVE 1-like n=1 Tax=Rosa rugosa TaxID=74645 RepID=UPI002B4138F0|nr:protein LEAD-SENSITIVE 1-like [Rosa rugosa]